MIKRKVKVYTITSNNKTITYDSFDDAMSMSKTLVKYGFKKELLPVVEKYEYKYEAEVGDRVKLKDDKARIIPDRIDEIVKITENSWGDKVYLTQEINGDKKAQVYPSYIELIKED